MTRPDNDPELASRFAALRRDEEEQCPPFDEFRRRTRARSAMHHRPLFAATAVVGLAILVFAVWIGLRTDRPAEPIPSIAEWRSPTGFLLETPGREVLSAPAGLGRSVLDFSSLNKGRSPS
jgi:hypothetical protein